VSGSSSIAQSSYRYASPHAQHPRWRWAAAAFWLANGANHFLPAEVLQGDRAAADRPVEGQVNALAGVAELVGWRGRDPRRTRPAARWWLLATLLAVYPANIHMALRPEKFPRFPRALLWATAAGAGLFALHVARHGLSATVRWEMDERAKSIPTSRLRRTAKLGAWLDRKARGCNATKATNLTRSEEGRRAAAERRQLKAAEHILDVLGQ
jgi:uncharacterized membrane protein